MPRPALSPPSPRLPQPQPLQAYRRSFFYWRQVWGYRLALDSGAFEGSKVPFKFLRFVSVVLAVKMVEKGFRALKEENLHDYNARKANVAAAEKALWDEELALHAVDLTVAEASVLRQRTVDWTFRSQPAAHAKVMHQQMMPFVAVERLS